jgi:alpha-mannosidase
MLVLPPGAPREPNRSIDLEPASLQMSALIPRDDGYDLRLLNASASPQEGVVRIQPLPRNVTWVSLAGDLNEQLAVKDGAYQIRLRPWEIATLRVER